MSKPAKPPPPGWRLFNRELVPDPTIGGFLARRQEIRGACYRRDCRRRWEADFDGLVRHGYAGFPMSELQGLLRCRTPGGCSLQFHESPEGAALTLGAVSEFTCVVVVVRFETCQWRTEVQPARMAARLERQGLGGDATTHTEIAGKLSRPCKCGKTRWACEVLWPVEAIQWQVASARAEAKARRSRR